MILIGAFSAALGIKGFLLSSHFIDGGVTGMAMLASLLSPLPTSWGILLLNLPFLALGYRQVGLVFTLKSMGGILLMALFLAFVPFPDVTPDKLLTAIFGGFFIGMGIGLTIRGGAVLDGTEIAALLISKSYPFFKVSDAILGMNIVIFATAAFVLGIESALYSIITYFTASKLIDYIVDGVEEYTGVTIISNQSEAIREMIISEMGRGITIYQGKGGYVGVQVEQQTKDILYTVVTKLEVGKLQDRTRKLDPQAFMIFQSINDIKGGTIKKRGHF